SKYDEVIEFESFREAINFYISSENLSSSFDSLKTQLLDNILKRIKKDEKILDILAKEKIDKADYEKYKEQGDILAACIYSIKKGMTFVETYDFYNDTMIKIPLEPQHTPQENLEKIYKKYNKLKRGLEANSRRVIEVTEDLD
ncbi:NFACT family protein, partial [Fusobacterium mortiferum]